MKTINDQLNSTNYLDLRSQKRYTDKGLLDKQAFDTHMAFLKDMSGHTVPTTLEQPALGLFDEETLVLVQKSFPYPKFKV